MAPQRMGEKVPSLEQQEHMDRDSEILKVKANLNHLRMVCHSNE